MNAEMNKKRETLALLALGAALIIGWIGSSLYYDWLTTGYSYEAFGLGLPVLVLALVIGGLVVAKLTGVPLRAGVLWLLAPIGFFAGMVAVRAESTLTLFNIGMTLALGGLLLHYLPTTLTPADEDTRTHIFAIIFSGIYGCVGGFAELTWIRSGLAHLKWRGNEKTGAVLRGIMIAVPVVIVFAALLASADSVFSEAVGRLFSGITNVPDLMSRIIVMLMFAWGALGLIAYGARLPVAAQPATPSSDSAENDEKKEEDETAQEIVAAAEAEEKAKRLPALGMIETSIVLGSVIALFAVFVLIQFTYLFGGQTNIREGVTYAQYARRGFFELVAVAVLVIGLGRYLHVQTRRQSTRALTLFRLEAFVLVGLTLVLLASAWRRMALYEEAYGFTHLRLYVYVFMLAVAALLGVFLLELFAKRKTLFAFGVLLTAIGYGVIMNGIGGEAFIAQRNIERYQQGQDLDICYLKSFGVDALPQMLSLLDIARSRTDAEVTQQVSLWLHEKSAETESLMNGPLAFSMRNLSRDAAYATLLTVPQAEQDAWAEAPYAWCYRSDDF